MAFYQLRNAVASGDIDAVKQALKNSDVNRPDKMCKSHLMVAAMYGYTDIVGLLLDHDAVIEGFDEHGGSALSYAIENGHIDVVKLLLGRGANPNAIDFDTGNTILYYALLYHNPDIVELLIERGIEPFHVDEYIWEGLPDNVSKLAILYGLVS